MTTKIIPTVDQRAASRVPVIPAHTLGRLLRDLRISVTDRCNFRCTYCMPKSVFDKDYRFLPKSELLSFEEITRMTHLFVTHGVEKIRLTGGEPLLRKNLQVLIEMLAALKTHDGKPLDMALTTNASLLSRKAQALKAAGLQRVNVSLDSLDEALFRAMNDVDFSVSDVLNGIDAAHHAGFAPIKINMVVKKGVNDQDIVAMARHFKGSGEIGVISSVTQAFCSTCTRARLSTDGKLYTCLFAQSGHDLRALMRSGKSDWQIAGAIGLIWNQREDRYSEIRTEETARRKKVEMSYIGG